MFLAGVFTGCLQIFKKLISLSIWKFSLSLKTHIGLKITNSQTSFALSLYAAQTQCTLHGGLFSNTEITSEFFKKVVYK